MSFIHIQALGIVNQTLRVFSPVLIIHFWPEVAIMKAMLQKYAWLYKRCLEEIELGGMYTGWESMAAVLHWGSETLDRIGTWGMEQKVCVHEQFLSKKTLSLCKRLDTADKEIRVDLIFCLGWQKFCVKSENLTKIWEDWKSELLKDVVLIWDVLNLRGKQSI